MNPLYHQTQYSTSAHSLSQLPEEQGIEIAFAGRSNAGKSSAINAITRINGLAKVSRTPGRTQLINYFNVDEQRFLVDLPGYGYAKVSQKQRRHWEFTLQKYLERRRSLRGLIIVMDIRHPLQDLDWQMIQWCHNAQLELHILLTKADKLSKSAANKALYACEHALSEAGIAASLQVFSALKYQGIDDMHSVLDEWFEIN